MKKAFLISPSLLILLLLGIVLASCSTNETATNRSKTATPSGNTTVPPTSSPDPAHFTVFSNNNFSLNYPHDWEKTQKNNNFSFSRGDNVTKFVVGINNKEQNIIAIITDLTGMVLSCDPQSTGEPSSVVVSNMTWQQSVLACFLASSIYSVHILTHANSQTNDQTVIFYGAYQQVASPAMIDFDQANKQYFQPMLQSLQIK